MVQPVNEALKLEQDAKISLFTLDLNPIGKNLIYRFCADKQTNGADVIWQTQTFVAHPIIAQGFERTNKGSQAKPTITASNIGGILSAILSASDDCVGAIVTRQRTYAKYLDGQAQANPLMEFTPDVFRVSRKASEDEQQITIELQDLTSFGNKRLPGRRFNKYICPWRYRSADCGYTGVKYFDKNDKPANDPSQDVCGHRLSSCECRFGANNPLPFGGFPGVDD